MNRPAKPSVSVTCVLKARRYSDHHSVSRITVHAVKDEAQQTHPGRSLSRVLHDAIQSSGSSDLSLDTTFSKIDRALYEQLGPLSGYRFAADNVVTTKEQN